MIDNVVWIDVALGFDVQVLDATWRSTVHGEGQAKVLCRWTGAVNDGLK